MSHGETLNIFGGASSASQRAMWKRQVSHRSPDATVEDRGTKISLPNGEQIHDISKLYEKRCKKDEQRKAHRFMSGVQTARSFNDGRQAIDPAVTLTNKLNDTPVDANYNTDCGSKKSLQKSLDDSANPYLASFGSSTDRFASAAAYRASTFASVVKEPYADPDAIGPGTYRTKKRAIEVKRKQVPMPAYLSKSSRFEEAKSNVQAVLAGQLGDAGMVKPPSPSSKLKGPMISPTPRFKSGLFPEQYVSSKQHQQQHDAPDRFYDISSSCKFTIDSSVKRSNFKCATMQSRVLRLASEASMVHNMPNFPILASATKEAIGPGAYNSVPTSPPRPTTRDGMNFIMMPQHNDRFGLPSANASFVETRFRRFSVEPHPPASPRSTL